MMLQERLKNDCILAVQLLHCRPSEFIAYKLNEVTATFHCEFWPVFGSVFTVISLLIETLNSVLTVSVGVWRSEVI